MGRSVHLVFYLGDETMKTISRETLRAALRAKFGSGNYRITRNDEVHVYGLMPNARNVGWWLMGDILSAELWLGLHAEVPA
tara:strand:+ start:1943 stop:2185 length:243 start_codon:yes stop_codon:yes gene_type:complete